LAEPFKPLPEGWQDIRLDRDPHTNEANVEGKIQMIVGSYIDVSLKSLVRKNPNKERHVLVPKSEYSEKSQQFEDHAKGKSRCFSRGQNAIKLSGLFRKDITVQYYIFTLQRYLHRLPDGFVVR
jgi:hypothetical protein